MLTTKKASQFNSPVGSLSIASDCLWQSNVCKALRW